VFLGTTRWGFVLPRAWDPWSTILRQDPFRRRYDRDTPVDAGEELDREVGTVRIAGGCLSTTTLNP